MSRGCRSEHAALVREMLVETDDRSGHVQPAHVVPAPHERPRVARAGVRQAQRAGVEDRDESHDEQPRILDRIEEHPVEGGEDLAGVVVVRERQRPDGILDEGGVHRGLDAFAADVGDDEEPAVLVRGGARRTGRRRPTRRGSPRRRPCRSASEEACPAGPERPLQHLDDPALAIDALEHPPAPEDDDQPGRSEQQNCTNGQAERLVDTAPQLPLRLPEAQLEHPADVVGVVAFPSASCLPRSRCSSAARKVRLPRMITPATWVSHCP